MKDPLDLDRTTDIEEFLKTTNRRQLAISEYQALTKTPTANWTD